MIKEIKRIGRWIKERIKRILIILGFISIASAATLLPITPDEIAWKAFTNNLIAIDYVHKIGIFEIELKDLVNLKGIWEPTTENDFKEIYRYVYGKDMVPWQKLDGTEMSPLITLPDGSKDRIDLVPHWEQEFNNAKERGELKGNIMQGLRNGVRENEVNADTYSLLKSTSQGFDLRDIVGRLIGIVVGAVEFEDHFGDAGAHTALKDWTPDTTGSGYTDLITVGSCDLYVDRYDDTIDGYRSDYTGGCGLSEGELDETDDTMSNADYEVKITQLDGDTSDDVNNLACRITDSTHFYVLLWNEDDSDLHDFDGTCSASLDDGPGIADGSIVELICNGTSITVEDDGVEILSITDSTHTSAGKAGIGMGQIGCDSYHDVSRQILDNFVVNVTGVAARRTWQAVPE